MIGFKFSPSFSRDCHALTEGLKGLVVSLIAARSGSGVDYWLVKLPSLVLTGWLVAQMEQSEEDPEEVLVLEESSSQLARPQNLQTET